MRIIKIFRPIFILLILISSFLTIACRKDITSEADITKDKWKLKSVVTEQETFVPQSKDYDNNGYILAFENDSVFTLNTSVNLFHSKYKISEKGKIGIDKPMWGTKVGTADKQTKKVDENLVDVFGEATTYKLIGNTLTFKGAKGEVKFKQE